MLNPVPRPLPRQAILHSITLCQSLHTARHEYQSCPRWHREESTSIYSLPEKSSCELYLNGIIQPRSTLTLLVGREDFILYPRGGHPTRACPTEVCPIGGCPIGSLLDKKLCCRGLFRRALSHGRLPHKRTKSCLSWPLNPGDTVLNQPRKYLVLHVQSCCPLK